MGKCMYCGINTGLFKSVHANCQEQYTTNMVALMESGRFKDAADAAEKSVYAAKSLTAIGHFLLSTIYFTAMCNA